VVVQVAYAIGVAEPVGLHVDTRGTAKVKMSDGEIAKKVRKLFDLRPYAIEQRFKLRTPIYQETAAYGHMGRPSVTKVKKFRIPGTKKYKTFKVILFPWERLDHVEKIQKAFNIKAK